MLCGSGLGVEVDEVVDGSVFHAGMEALVLSMKVHRQVGGCMEVVIPTEMVGMVLLFKPGR